MRYSIAAFPLVGAVIGIIWLAVYDCAARLELPAAALAFLLAAVPLIVTGGFHLDGFMDVTDAVKSWRDLERRREILKDSRVGAFAVISCAALMIMQFAAAVSMELDGSLAGIALAFIPVISRCCSALAVTVLPPMNGSQYAGQERRKAVHAVVYLVLAAAFTAVAFVLCGRYGFAVIGVLAGYGLALLRAYRSLEGMNGDISGYALTIGELCGLIVLAVL